MDIYHNEMSPKYALFVLMYLCIILLVKYKAWLFERKPD